MKRSFQSATYSVPVVIAAAIILPSCGAKKTMMKAMMPSPPEQQTRAVGDSVAMPVRPAAATESEARLSNHAVAMGSTLRANQVEDLECAWFYDTDDAVSHAPLFVDGAIYFGDYGGHVYKIDAETGEEIWVTQDVQKPMRDWPWHGFAGTGVIVDGVLVQGSAEGFAYGLDTETGEVLWRREVADDPEAGSIGTLLAHDGVVYMGITSVEEILHLKKKGFVPNFQGSVLALDPKTGEIQWRRQLATGESNGAGMWSSFALDPELGLLYFTTSNSYTGKASDLSDAVVAVELGSGAIRWSRQVVKNDTWTPARPIGPDFAFGAGPQLFEAEIEGRQRSLVGAGNKSGFFYVYDRATGETVYEANLGYSGIEGGLMGEVSIANGTIFAWTNNSYFHVQPPFMVPQSILAFDASTGRVIWAVEKAQPASLRTAGLLANDVYFAPSLDGKVRAYRARDGEKMWTSEAHGPVTGAPTSVGDWLFFSTGLVPIFGDWASGKSGVAAYALPSR